MPRRDLKGLRAILTGASSGIGRELAVQLCSQGMQLVVTGRREDRLRQLCEELRTQNAQVDYSAGDITDERVQRSLVSKCVDQYGGIDVLINNAGMGSLGSFIASSPETLRRIFEVNFFAAVELTRIALPQLAQGRMPLIVNVGSVLGHRAVPNKSEYCSSKFALHGFSDALRAELFRQGIQVLLVSPSTTETEFFDRAAEVAASHQSVSEREQPSCGKPTRHGMSTERVAKKIIAAMQRGNDELIISASGTLLVWIDRICPPFANWLVRRFP